MLTAPSGISVQTPFAGTTLKAEPGHVPWQLGCGKYSRNGEVESLATGKKANRDMYWLMSTQFTSWQSMLACFSVSPLQSGWLYG